VKRFEAHLELVVELGVSRIFSQTVYDVIKHSPVGVCEQCKRVWQGALSHLPHLGPMTTLLIRHQTKDIS